MASGIARIVVFLPVSRKAVGRALWARRRSAVLAVCLRASVLSSILTYLSGKYWHRYRKPRPCEYHADLEYHQNHLNEVNRAKQASQASRRKGRPPANPHPIERAASERSESPIKREAWVEIPTRRNNSSRSITRVQSPVTSDDSDDEAPLATKRRTNGSAAASTPGEDGSVGPQVSISR
jgi:hypothetical protein